MDLRRKARRRILPALFALGLACAPTAGAVTIDEFPLAATPTGIAAGPDGDVYVTTSAPSILRVSPAGDVTARYPITWTGSPVPSRPVFAGGALWFALKRTDPSTNAVTMSLARRAPDGALTEFPVATPAATVGWLAPGPDGNVWFTESGAKDAIGRITPSGLVTEFPGVASPTSIVADASGQLWVTGSAAGASVALVSATGVVTPTSITAYVWKAAAAPSTSAVWFAGRTRLCCYGQPWLDFAYWQVPGATGGRAGAGFLATAKVQDLAVASDGNAWMTDQVVKRIGRVSTSGRTTAFTAGLGAGALPHFITAGAGNTLWFTDDAGSVGRITLERPATTTEPATEIAQTSAGVGAIATPHGTAARVRFEYGTTTTYGMQTRWQDLGDGDATLTRNAGLDGLTPGTTYHYRAVVTSAFGLTPGADRTFSTVPLPPPPPAPPADVDGDGYAAAVDCNDKSAAVYPGAVDVPGDGIDQDCSGADEALQRFFPHITAYFKNLGKRWSRFTALTVDDVPASAGVELRCRGRGCRFKRWTMTVRKDVDRLDLLRRLRGSKLTPGATLELRLELAGQMGTVVRWKVGPPPKPVVTCLPPGAKKDRRC